MIYQGSKSKIASQIVSVLNDNITDNKVFADVFCGGCGVSEFMPLYKFDRVLLNDRNKYLIAILSHYSKGGGFSEYYQYPTKEEWQRVKDNKDEDLVKAGIYGFMCGYRGFFFEGYYPTCKDGEKTRNNYLERFNNFLNTASRLNSKNIEFYCGDYRELEIPEVSLIYCDPPYSDTRNHYTFNGFNSQLFWEWAEKKSQTNKLIVSELNAPSDWECIKEIPFTYRTAREKGKTVTDVIEKLFVHKSQLSKWKIKKQSLWI